MANNKKDINSYVLRYIGEMMKKRIEEKGMTKYSFIKKYGLVSPTTYRILDGQASYNLATLIEFLDILDLEIRIVKKPSAND